jgi:heme oxygenase
MKLHTRQQAPKEGKAEAPPNEKPVSKWSPTMAGYLQFLVDSKLVYATLEEIVAEHAGRKGPMAALTNTGLERAAALEKDIAFLAAKSGLPVPPVGASGTAYAALLKSLAADPKGLPKLINHYYNYYFAHTAGGRMIGKSLAKELLDDHELDFYQWTGDVKAMLGAATEKIDAIAFNWTPEEKNECLEETGPAFRYGGSMMAYIR